MLSLSNIYISLSSHFISLVLSDALLDSALLDRFNSLSLFDACDGYMTLTHSIRARVCILNSPLLFISLCFELFQRK